MSGTWSRKRRSGNNAAVVPSTSAATAAAAAAAANRDKLRDQVPIPGPLQRQQQLLSRSTDRMFEEAELSGVLSLAGRKLKDFPQSLTQKYDITDVVAADLSSNRLAEIPSSICELRSLESLRMKSNVLRRVPSNVFLMDCLTYLDLSNNQLTSLPVCLFDLPIEILLLSGNRLDNIPREIRQLSTTLNELDVSCNLLRSIPADLALLKMLKILSLRRNMLDQFPSELCRLTLQFLDLSSNNFTQLPLHIRKMKTLIDLRIHENPLQSPPANIIAKGREHVFKWMDVESGGAPHPVCSARSTYSSSTLRALNLGRSTIHHTDDSETLRKSSAPVIERRARNARFNTVGGSDSGYASTADEHRLSHELPSSGLDEITEISVFSPSPDEGLGETERSDKKTGSPMDSGSSSGGSTSPVRQMATTSITAHIVNPQQQNVAQRATTISGVYKSTVANIKSPEAVPSPVIIPPNPNKEDTKADDTNNNTSSTIINSEKKVTTAPIRKPISRPISKVAPLVQNTRSPTNGNTVIKPAVKPTQPPPATPPKTATVTRVLTPRPAVPPPSRPPLGTKMGTTAASVRRPITIPVQTATTTTNSTMRPRVPTQVPVKHIGVPTTSNGKASTPTGGPLKRPIEVKKPILKSSSLENTSENHIVENMRKTMEDRLGVSLDSEKEALASQLSDGVLLCTFANAIRIRSVATVLTSVDKTALSSPKAKRNVDNFVAACRRLGVPEASISSPSDILLKKNVVQTGKTILALSRLFPKKVEARKINQ